MSSERPGLRERLREDLRSGSLPVILTGVVLALPVAYAVMELTHVEAMGFFGLITVGVVVPQAHEHHWPTYGGWRDVAWTVVTTVVAVTALLLVYWGVTAIVPRVGVTAAAIAAFLIVDFGGLYVVARYGPGAD